MKSSQTAVLLVVIVVMVFAVTFASMYVRQGETDKPPPEKDPEGGPVLSLTFTSDRYPDPLDDMRNRVVTEFGRKGHYEFWFRNDNDQEVRLGMNSKNCTCSEVLVYLVPQDWQKELATSTLAGYPLASAASAAVAEERIRRRVERLRDNEFTHLDEAGRNSFKVPAGARGVVRLVWEARRVGTSPHPSLLQAELWATHRRNRVALQVGALFLDPIRLDKTDIAVGTISPGTPARGEVRCWTSLYPSLRVEATSEGGFVEVGDPQPLTDADRTELSGFGGRVKAGYRIPVQLRDRTPSGKPVPLGPFQYTLTIKPFVKDGQNETALETQQVTFRGVVRGDLVVHGGENGIRLETFRVGDGIVHEAELTTDRTDLDLRLISSPKFMKVKLDKHRPGNSGRPRWTLTVEIPPGAIESGAFPRPGLEAYRDCTILLRIGGEDGRDFRIPVSGIARR